ncbi:MAG TPA: four helix bundle protein [Candidatus Acidoferrum sp.]|jgi:four helix bundle protein|nr:four helix bundle protein [Candidatus Acidoferrum sp.]
MEDFKDLRVWAKAHELTLAVYQKTRAFPKEEMYGLTSQLRRASASVGANIAEGCGRRSDAELRRFVQIARGSANEVEYHLLLAKDLDFLSAEEHEDLEARVLEIQRMLAGLVQSLKFSILASSQ